MQSKYTISKWKLPLIRWALRQLKPLLPTLYQCSFATIEILGIDGIEENEHTGEFAIYIS